MKPHNFTNYRKHCFSESGVMLPLVAVLAAGVLAVIVTLGFDLAKSRSVADQLTQIADEFCRETSKVAYHQRAAALTFREQVNNLIASGKFTQGELISANLILPTMPADGCFGFVDEYNDCQTSSPFRDIGLPPGEDFGSLLGNDALGNPLRCNLASGDCRYSGKINTDRYLSSLWNPLQGAGSTVACEFQASVKTTFIGRRTVNAKSNWKIPPKRVETAPAYDPSSVISSASGITIAIAPQMTTWASKARFNFDTTFPDRAKYDPLDSFGDASTGVNAFQFAPPYTTFPGATYQYEHHKAGILDDTNRKEMLVACMNPAILVRNLLVDSILERASRHGDLRSATEILSVATQHRVVRDINRQGARSYLPNNPVKIVPFGDDLLARDFQLPAVFYNSGVTPLDPANTYKNVPPHFEFGQGGWINPFSPSTTPPTDEMKLHHALVANQLRYCYHLFHGPDKGIERARAFGQSALAENNSGFEPDGIDEAYEFKPRLRPPYQSGADQSWEQNCPWRNDSAPRTGAQNLGQNCLAPLVPSSGMNALEVVSMLGSVQRCPYEQTGLDAGGSEDGIPGGICTKPVEPVPNAGNQYKNTNDLRPDLLGLMLYLAGEPYRNIPSPSFVPSPIPSPAPAPPSGPFEALRSPGIFPLITEPSANPWRPFIDDPTPGMTEYLPAANFNTSILLVTHQRLLKHDAGNAPTNEIGQIRKLFDDGKFRNRHVTVVYIPTEEMDSLALQDAIKDFQSAFHIDSNAAHPHPQNHLFVFSPMLEQPIFPDDFPAGSWGTTADEKYHQYWNSLLTDPQNNVFVSGKNIFEKVILDLTLKF